MISIQSKATERTHMTQEHLIYLSYVDIGLDDSQLALIIVRRCRCTHTVAMALNSDESGKSKSRRELDCWMS